MEILLICRPYTYEHSTKTISSKYEVTAAKSMFDSLLCLIHYVIGHSRRDWHEWISLNQHSNGFWPQNFGQPPKQFRKNTEICTIDSFLQANHDPIQKKEFLQAILEIISLQNWLKIGTFQCQSWFWALKAEKRYTKFGKWPQNFGQPHFFIYKCWKMCNWLLFQSLLK